jgi:hypothetical protein
VDKLALAYTLAGRDLTEFRRRLLRLLLGADNTGLMIAKQYIAERKEQNLHANFCHKDFLVVGEPRTFPSAKRQNTQLCCVAAIVHCAFPHSFSLNC